MKKIILCLLLTVSVIGVIGCDLIEKATGTSTTATTTPPSLRNIRDAELAETWKVQQMEIDLKNDTSLTMELEAGDKVDGYFYLLKGDDIGFNVSGASALYISQPPEDATRITSDRFSFTATAAQGGFYKLTFDKDADSGSEIIVFMELVYPVTGSLSVPFGTK